MSAAATVGMDQLQCSVCGIVFWAPTKWVQERREDHQGFRCPNNHSQYFPQESEAEKLRKQLDSEQKKHRQALDRAMRAEILAQDPPLSEAQEHEVEWLRRNVKGVGYSRARAIIREFGRVRTFAEAGDTEVSELLTSRMGTTVSLNFAREMIHRTQVALRTHGKKLLPSEAGPSNYAAHAPGGAE